ncbi:DNA-binding FadR family transcriptional regulator [Hydrogenispora ethanolica]|jgi:DNA-binding FadR family transcriptional regulator|uniref:DNA-binding FadR family transcriptional regulator n=1 Tax=Hydrogenispora ethanolica TaxID=1082276 RepID=A0A4R1RW30_HYDET|nr:FadR/GntR family transcriptional regulator [Hydrogenispora ethanolica]TCL70878.1 DNA-binding FadR family transcriptional regulator [Hydrogenispora ethanolica]
MELVSFGKTVLSQEISENLRELISDKKLKPGDKLPNEIELSRMMGVSRSTVREAIKALASNNILEVVRGKGTFVCQEPGFVTDSLGVKFLKGDNLLFSLFETRTLVEPGVAYLAAQRATKSDLRKIRECINVLSELIERNEPYIEEDMEFHQSIAKATKNPIIQRIVPIINQSIIHGYYQTMDIPGSSHNMVEAHHRIYTAIKNGDSNKAREEMLHHLELTLGEIQSNINKGGKKNENEKELP